VEELKPLLGGPPSEEALDLYPHLEWADSDRNLEQASAAKKLKPMPFIAFQSDEPFDFTPFVEDGTLPMTLEEAEQFRILLYNAWHDAIGDLVSQVPGARFIDDPHSGHYIHQEQPQLVIDSVREVLYAVEQQSPSLLTDTGGVPPSVFLLASAAAGHKSPGRQMGCESQVRREQAVICIMPPGATSSWPLRPNRSRTTGA
jgi:hypothetical protein